MALLQSIELLQTVERRYRAYCSQWEVPAKKVAFALTGLQHPRYAPTIQHLHELLHDKMPEVHD